LKFLEFLSWRTRMPSEMRVDPKEELKLLFGTDKYVIGMVHLLPLPGSPLWMGQMADVLKRAVGDAQALEDGGIDGLIIENFGDTPFSKGRVRAHTVSAMTLAVEAVRHVVHVPVGVNVLRNDSMSALAIASTTGAQFIRVNVHTGAMITDQGMIESRAHETLRYRQELGTSTKILADVFVKHATPLGSQTLEQAARDAVHRGLADAVIVTGGETGQPADMDDVLRAKEAVPDFPVLAGSGAHEGNVAQLLARADGVIVGTSLKEDGITTNPVDRARVVTFMTLVNQLR
jgi:membrane complex biogenesis BtpA family protein